MAVHEAKAQFEIEVGSERAFGVTFSVAFGVVAILPLFGGHAVRQWAVVAAAVMLVTALLVPRLLVVPNRIWFRLGLLLGSLVSQIVMFALFFLVVTPTGIVMRVFRNSSISYRRGPDSSVSTYWIPRGTDNNPMGSMRNQF